MAARDLIQDINDKKDRWKILVRVTRKWNVYPKTSPNDLFAITMVLMDEEGSKIQASVTKKELHQKFLDTAEQGKVYFIANFSVFTNTATYRPTTHPFKITFTKATHIEEEEARLPKYSYSFVSLPDILKVKECEDLPHLIDVIAFVKSIGNPEEYRRDAVTKTKLRMILTDNEDSDVECVLWDECSNTCYSSYLKAKGPPIVLILTLARIGFSEDGVAQIHNSYNATNVEFNLPIKEVKQFIAKHSDGKSPIVTPLTQTFSGTYSHQPSASMLSKANRIPISAIPDQQKGETFVINCEIQKLGTIYGWFYDGCSKCSTKVKDDEGELKCPQCKKKPNSVEPRLKLHYTVADNSGSSSVVFWDKDAVQLVKKTATQLKFILAESKREYDFPDELEDVVGKRSIIKLRKNDFNIKFPKSSISVIQFLMCDDLLDQFNGAASGGDDDDDMGRGRSKKYLMKHARKSKTEAIEGKQNSDSESDVEPITLLGDEDDEDVPIAKLPRARKATTNRSTNSKVVTDKHLSPSLYDEEPITVLGDDEEEDIPIARFSRSVSTKNNKGKKKVNNKRSPHSESSGVGLPSPVKPSTEKKIRETIKKEKDN